MTEQEEFNYRMQCAIKRIRDMQDYFKRQADTEAKIGNTNSPQLNYAAGSYNGLDDALLIIKQELNYYND